MKGVKFNDIHSYKDLNLVLAPFQMPPAEPKTNFIDVPGADGSLDMTEALGEVKFNDRTGSMTFSVLPQDDFEVKKTQVSNILNGLKCKITLDKDPEFYYFGRLSVSDYKANKMLRQITVDFRVQPYKYKQTETVVFLPFCEKNLIPYPYTGTFGESGGLTYTDNGDGTITVKGTVTDAFSWLTLHNDLALADGVTYYLGGSSLFLSYKDETGATKYAIHGKTITWSKKYTLGRAYLQYPKGEVIDEIVYPMLCVGDSEAAYEPYTPKTTIDVVLLNNRKSIVPTITTTAETTVTFDGGQHVLGAGTHKVLDIQLLQGENPMTLEGSGTTIITYQEGAL